VVIDVCVNTSEVRLPTEWHVVIAGLDPAIHHLRVTGAEDSAPGQARAAQEGRHDVSCPRSSVIPAF
jgi:hypothetical protein